MSSKREALGKEDVASCRVRDAEMGMCSSVKAITRIDTISAGKLVAMTRIRCSSVLGGSVAVR